MLHTIIGKVDAGVKALLGSARDLPVEEVGVLTEALRFMNATAKVATVRVSGASGAVVRLFQSTFGHTDPGAEAEVHMLWVENSRRHWDKKSRRYRRDLSSGAVPLRGQFCLRAAADIPAALTILAGRGSVPRPGFLPDALPGRAVGTASLGVLARTLGQWWMHPVPGDAGRAPVRPTLLGVGQCWQCGSIACVTAGGRLQTWQCGEPQEEPFSCGGRVGFLCDGSCACEAHVGDTEPGGPVPGEAFAPHSTEDTCLLCGPGLEGVIVRELDGVVASRPDSIAAGMAGVYPQDLGTFVHYLVRDCRNDAELSGILDTVRLLTTVPCRETVDLIKDGEGGWHDVLAKVYGGTGGTHGTAVHVLWISQARKPGFASDLRSKAYLCLWAFPSLEEAMRTLRNARARALRPAAKKMSFRDMLPKNRAHAVIKARLQTLGLHLRDAAWRTAPFAP
jgi:hypothetical protein